MHQIEYWFFNLDPFEKGLLIYFLVLFIIWIWQSGSGNLNEPVFSFFRTKPVYSLAVNKKEFVCEVVRWGLRNISYEGAEQKRKAINVEVSYYPHKKLHGFYNSSQSMIRIYVNNHPNVDDLIDTTLHEVVHLLQFCSDKKNFEKRYSTLLSEKSYANHPMEIEARKIASANTSACKKYLIEQGKLRIQQ